VPIASFAGALFDEPLAIVALPGDAGFTVDAPASPAPAAFDAKALFCDAPSAEAAGVCTETVPPPADGLLCDTTAPVDTPASAIDAVFTTGVVADCGA
jgi:hypothetical protein